MRKNMKKVYGMLLGTLVFLIFFLSVFFLQYANEFKLDKSWTVLDGAEEYEVSTPFFRYTSEAEIVRVKNSFEGENWKYLVFPMISGNGFRVYINGRLLGQVGEMEKGTPNSWNYCHIFAIDEGILKEDNIMELEIYSLFTFGIESDPYLTADSEVYDRVGILNYLKSTLPTMGIGAGYLIGLILIILGLSFEKKNEMYIHMGICAVLSSFFLTDDIFRISTLNQEFFLWYRKISIICGFASTYFFLASIELYSKDKKSFSKYSFWVTLACSIGLLLQPGFSSVAIYGRYAGLIVILNITLALLTYFRNIDGREWLIFPFTFLTLSILDYVLFIQIMRLQFPNMFSFGLIFINIGFGIILIHHHKKLIANLNRAKNEAMMSKNLEEKSRFLEKLFDSVPFPVFYQAGNGEIITSNREYEKMLIKEKAFRKLSKMNASSCISGINWYEEVVKSSVKRISREIKVDFGEGEMREYLVTCSQISGMFVNQIQTGIVGVFIDISKRKEMEQYLKQTKDNAVEASRMKTKFLASMSHEIRNPITGILGMIDLMSETELNVFQKEYLNTIETCSRNLMSIVNDILDISKIEAGKYEMNYVSFSLKGFAEQMFSVYHAMVKAKGLELQLEYPSEDHWIVSDENRLKQIIGNFMSNAVKFTEKGFIKLRVIAEKNIDREEELSIEFHVEDSGKGIAKSALGKIFESYEQEDSAISSKYGGTGLGLAISKELAGLLGGVISVNSELGKGSDFSLKINVKTAIPRENVLKQKDEGMKLRDLKILLAEDNEINRKIAGAYIEKMGAEYDVAENGGEALKMVENNPYDMILMDINMPVANGFEVLDALRKPDCGNRDIPVIAFTAHVMDDYVKKIMEHGFDGYITKPFTEEALRKEMKRVLNLKDVKAANSHKKQLENLRDRTGMDVETFEAVFNDFKKSIPIFLTDFETAMRTGDFDRLYSLAHDFKSNLGFLGGKTEFEAICRINDNCKLKNIANISKDFEFLSKALKSGVYIDKKDG